MKIGSTQKEQELPENVKIAKQVRDSTATISGLSAEAQIQAQRIENIYQRLNSLENLTQTLLNENRELKQRFGMVMQQQIGGGPTA